MNLRAFLRNFLLLLKENVVSIFCLMVGMMITVFVVSYIVFENSFDSFHKKKKRIYHVSTQTGTQSGDSALLSRTHLYLKDYVDDQIPQIELSCRLHETEEILVADQEKYKDHYGLHVDADFFRIFDYTMIAGQSSCLEEPGQMILTRSLAKKIFGPSDCLGSELELDEAIFTVSGIVDDPPANSNLRFDYLLPMQNFTDSLARADHLVCVETYILCFDKHIEQTGLKASLNSFFKEYGIGEEGSYQLHLENLTRQNPYTSGHSSTYFLFISISILTLGISVFNFINSFATGCELRTKDNGIRRIMGAQRALLVRTLLIQSVMISLIASAGALMLTGALLGPFRKLSGLDIALFGPGLWRTQIIVSLITILAGFLGGLFPAVKYTSRDQRCRSRLPLNKVLFVTQFSISTSLLIVLFLFLGQLQFLSLKDPGFEMEDRILIKIEGRLVSSFQKYRDEIAAIPSVLAVSGSISEFGKTIGLGIKKDEESDYMAAMGFIVQDGFFRAYGIRLAEGLSFEESLGSGAASVIIDKSTARILGMDQPVGKKIHVAGREMQVIGLVEDAELIAMKGQRMPFVYTQLVNQCEELIIHHRGDPAKTAMEITRRLRAFEPDFEYNYRDIQEARDQLYMKERKQVHMILFVVIIAIFISMGGAYAMTCYRIGHRAREISIRKVLGATVNQVVNLIIKEIFWMIGIAFLIAVPLAYLISIKWLQNFTHRIRIGPHFFISALLILTLLILFTVLSRVRQAALMNPVEKIRNE